MLDKALEHHRIVVGLTPDSADAHFNLGLTYFRKGEMDKARDEFKVVLRLNPNFDKARRMMDQSSSF
jgi:tetratricopeptide (TPR) repeat protein